MLSKEQIEELRNAVASGDLRKVTQSAKNMGIKIKKKNPEYDGMYNKDGMLEKLDMYSHFRDNGTVNIPLIMELTSNDTQVEAKFDEEVDE